MTITVTFANAAATLAAVRIEPHRIRRIFGAEVRYELATGVTTIAGGTLWVWDTTGRPVKERRIVEALERAQTKALGERRVAGLRGADEAIEGTRRGREPAERAGEPAGPRRLDAIRHARSLVGVGNEDGRCRMGQGRQRAWMDRAELARGLRRGRATDPRRIDPLAARRYE